MKFFIRQTKILILIAIIVLSLLLRIYDLGGESIWYDEGASVYGSKEPMSTIISKSNMVPNLVLYYTMLYFWVQLFGYSEFSVRFLSVIFGVLSVYVIYKLGELVFDANIGLLSAFILAISSYHIRYSQEARSYSLLILLVLLSSYYLIKVLENKERKYIIGYIISSIGMIYAHGYGIFYLIFQNIYYLVFKRKDIKLWIVVQGIILSFFVLPFLLRDVRESLDTAYDLRIPTLNSIYNTFEIFVGKEQILYIFILVIIIGLIIDLVAKKDLDKYQFMILWLFVPFIISVIISYTIQPIYHNRYFIASFPTLILLFSKGISNFRKAPIILFVLFIVVVLQVPLIEGYYKDIQKDQWREATNYIENNTKDNDIILLYPKFTKIPFDYYYQKDINYIGINNSLEINSSINNGNRIWLITSHLYYKERKEELELIEKELSNTYIKKKTIEFIGIKINLYENSTIQDIDILENISVTDLSKKDAIKRFNLSEDNIKIVSIIPVEWTDTSIGFPEQGKEIGKDYPLETIQGYVIIISANGKLYEYHSDYYRIVPPTGYIENIIPMIINDS